VCATELIVGAPEVTSYIKTLTENDVSADATRAEFDAQEPVYICTDIIKPNLIVDSYMRSATAVKFPSPTGYHRYE
jgi:hypothetical protein